jgi:hypothetical protein
MHPKFISSSKRFGAQVFDFHGFLAHFTALGSMAKFGEKFL